MYVKLLWVIPRRRTSGKQEGGLAPLQSGSRKAQPLLSRSSLASRPRGWVCTRFSGGFLLCNVFHFHISPKLSRVLGLFPKKTDNGLDAVRLRLRPRVVSSYLRMDPFRGAKVKSSLSGSTEAHTASGNARSRRPAGSWWPPGDAPLSSHLKHAALEAFSFVGGKRGTRSLLR